MAEWGYGSPSSIPNASTSVSTFDWGYGSEPPSSWTQSSPELDSGYGSPFVQLAALVASSADRRQPDHGGPHVEIVNPSGWPQASFFKIQLRGADGTLFPGSASYVHSGVASRGDELQTTGSGTRLAFALPPLPTGLYDIIVYWGNQLGNTHVISSAVLVVRRLRFGSTYFLRQGYPDLMRRAAGPLVRREENLLDSKA